MKTATDIIEALGGTVKVARALSLSPTTVSSWKTAKRGIPSWRWEKVEALAKREGVALS
jgi:DNA-binding transcriptional regulator YdaS (Cro superfamily)